MDIDCSDMPNNMDLGLRSRPAPTIWEKRKRSQFYSRCWTHCSVPVFWDLPQQREATTQAQLNQLFAIRDDDAEWQQTPLNTKYRHHAMNEKRGCHLCSSKKQADGTKCGNQRSASQKSSSCMMYSKQVQLCERRSQQWCHKNSRGHCANCGLSKVFILFDRKIQQIM